MGAIGIVIQDWALYQMVKADGFSQMDLTQSSKMTTAITEPIGALMEFAGTFIQNTSKYTRLVDAKGLSPNIAFYSKICLSRLSKYGKVLSGVGGIIDGVLDFVQSSKESDKGNILLAKLYFISGAAGTISLLMALGFIISLGESLLLFIMRVHQMACPLKLQPKRLLLNYWKADYKAEDKQKSYWEITFTYFKIDPAQVY